MPYIRFYNLLRKTIFLSVPFRENGFKTKSTEAERTFKKVNYFLTKYFYLSVYTQFMGQHLRLDVFCSYSHLGK